MDEKHKDLIRKALKQGDRIEWTETKECVKIYRVRRELITTIPIERRL